MGTRMSNRFCKQSETLKKAMLLKTKKEGLRRQNYRAKTMFFLIYFFETAEKQQQFCGSLQPARPPLYYNTI